MQPTGTQGQPMTAARETLHELANVLSSARMWLVVLGNTPPADREAVMEEMLEKLNKSVGDAEECCHRLRQLMPGGPSSRDDD